MARQSYALALTTPEAYRMGRVDPGPLPAGAAAVHPNAAPLVDLGLLAGEALGVDVAAALRVLEDATLSAELRRETYPEARRLLSDGDPAMLRDALAAAAEGLAGAVDELGRPRGEAGARLAASPSVTLDDRGRAVIGFRGRLAADLADDLPELVRLLDLAALRGLYVVDD